MLDLTAEYIHHCREVEQRCLDLEKRRGADASDSKALAQQVDELRRAATSLEGQVTVLTASLGEEKTRLVTAREDLSRKLTELSQTRKFVWRLARAKHKQLREKETALKNLKKQLKEALEGALVPEEVRKLRDRITALAEEVKRLNGLCTSLRSVKETAEKVVCEKDIEIETAKKEAKHWKAQYVICKAKHPS